MEISSMQITDTIKYVGVNDHKVDLFESQYIVPNGMALDSYVILDDKILVVDSVGGDFDEEWLANVKNVTGGKAPDYFLVQHMEPDHSKNITSFMSTYPNAVILASEKAFVFMNQFYHNDYMFLYPCHCIAQLFLLNNNTLHIMFVVLSINIAYLHLCIRLLLFLFLLLLQLTLVFLLLLMYTSP